MSLATARAVTSGHPRVRTAVTAVFALSGFVIASWAVRIPDVSTQVHAGHGALGLALLCVSLGALVAMRTTAGLADRLGLGRTTAIAVALLAATVTLPGLVHSVPALAGALLVFGGATGMLNVAMNSLGVHLEAETGRSLLPSMHAAFSFGGLGGSVVGGLAASVVGPLPHFVAVAVTGLVVSSFLTPDLVAGDEPRPTPQETSDPQSVGTTSSRMPVEVRVLVLTLGAIAGCTAYGEGALGDWAALHLSENLHASPVLAAAGYAVFSLAMACGRLAGHRLLERLGGTRLLVLGALLAAGGMMAAALTPDLVVALIGLVLVGLGLANVFPVAIARAGAAAGSRGVSLASTVGYAGLLTGPALIGFLAASVGLPIALTSVAALAAVAGGLALKAGRDEPVTWMPVLPWSPAEAVARVRYGVRGAAQRHAASLDLLTPHAAGTQRSADFTELVFGGWASR